MSSAPTKRLDLADGETLTLTGDIGGFRRFKAITRELGLGKPCKRTGKGRGISILSGDLGEVEDKTLPIADQVVLYPIAEELLPEFVAAFASTKDREISPDEAVELLEGVDVLETLDRIGDLMAECNPAEDEAPEGPEGDSDRNQEPEESPKSSSSPRILKDPPAVALRGEEELLEEFVAEEELEPDPGNPPGSDEVFPVLEEELEAST